jgi:hypothetical protein
VAKQYELHVHALEGVYLSALSRTAPDARAIVQQGLRRLCVHLPWVVRLIFEPPPDGMPRGLVVAANGYMHVQRSASLAVSSVLPVRRHHRGRFRPRRQQGTRRFNPCRDPGLMVFGMDYSKRQNTIGGRFCQGMGNERRGLGGAFSPLMDASYRRLQSVLLLWVLTSFSNRGSPLSV